MFRKVVLDNFESFSHVEMDLTDPHGKPLDHAFVLGPNGCGKTCLMRSFRFLVDSTLTPNGARSISELASGHRMADSDDIIRLEFSFVARADATYVMGIGPDGMAFESLDYRVDGMERNLFMVSRSDDGISTMFHEAFPDKEETEDAIAGHWGDRTALSVLRERIADGRAVYEGIRNVLRFIDGIRVCVYGAPSPYIDPECGTIPSCDRKLLEAREDSVSEFFSRAFPDFFGAHYDIKEDGGVIRYRLMFERRIGGSRRNIPATEESSGIRSLLRVLPYLLDSANGKTVLIDELDTEIHTNVIQDIMGELLNTSAGQLIATTHNTAILQDIDPRNAFVIRRVGYKGKEILPFSSLDDTRKGDDNEERYRNGAFGGAPVVSFVDLKEIAEASRRIAGRPRPPRPAHTDLPSSSASASCSGLSLTAPGSMFPPA
ncbi:MAG: ATP-binding protein [Thermoplasmata archaeon]|nr:ATP-binding protein [Thermoplasmata archaeon]